MTNRHVLNILPKPSFGRQLYEMCVSHTTFAIGKNHQVCGSKTFKLYIHIWFRYFASLFYDDCGTNDAFNGNCSINVNVPMDWKV